jgi:hypothetical protein
MTDLTPESEDTIKALTPSAEMEAWLRERMRRSEAAAIARDREGQKALREALLNALSLIPDRPDDTIARAVRKQARAALAIPEAQEPRCNHWPGQPRCEVCGMGMGIPEAQEAVCARCGHGYDRHQEGCGCPGQGTCTTCDGLDGPYTGNCSGYLLAIPEAQP